MFSSCNALFAYAGSLNGISDGSCRLKIWFYGFKTVNPLSGGEFSILQNMPKESKSEVVDFFGHPIISLGWIGKNVFFDVSEIKSCPQNGKYNIPKIAFPHWNMEQIKNLLP